MEDEVQEVSRASDGRSCRECIIRPGVHADSATVAHSRSRRGLSERKSCGRSGGSVQLRRAPERYR